MEQEPVSLGHDVQVVDPDVRGYVYSLVTAVCETRDDWPCAFTDANCDLARRVQWRRRRPICAGR